MASTKQNTPGLGIEYEVHLPAYFALLLNNNPEIEDFKLQSNVQEFGNLDDLLVDIKTKSGEKLYFAFQLKHKEKSSKNLLPTNFEARGDFNLEKYCEAFKKLNEENKKKYHFILYTNKNFDSSRTNEVQKFDMKQDECCLGRNFFDTSGDGKNLYKFEVNGETEDGKNVNKKDFREFFSKFSLYTGQTNIRDLDRSHILDILKYRECYVTYIDFFRRWHRGDFIDKILDKKTLNIHLVDILLSPVAINYHVSDGQDGNSIFFEALVQQFDITIIDASKQDIIKQLEKNIQKYPEEFNKNSEAEIIKLGKRSKLIDRFTKEVNEETKLKLLHYFYQKPLILDFHESSKDVIYQASKLCKIEENGIKLVIVGRDTDASKFSHLKIFTNLTGVDGNFLEEMKRRCKLSLQGRKISFEEIFEEEIREFFTPREIFHMLKGSFSIGEDKESLPEYYISRTVSATVCDIESIIKDAPRNVAIIFYYEDKFEELKILIQNIVNREDYLYEEFLDGMRLRKKEPSKTHLHQENSGDTLPAVPTIILRREECSREELDDICRKIGKDDIRLFKVIDEERCQLLMLSTKSRSFFQEIYDFSQMSIEESNIHLFFNNSINILCAQPGMGKSALMRCLKNQYDPNFWTVLVDLKAHNPFLKRSNHKMEEVLNYFLELDKCQDTFLLSIKNVFLRKKKIVLFFDGLDEVENECVDFVLNITRQLSEMGYKIWLSSRQNLQQKIEQYLNNFAIEINELNIDQQKNYIENRLTSMYGKNEIEEIVDSIFSNTDLANNRQILEIPLQLHIITQIFLDDKSYYSNISKNNFTLTKMFEIFFEGKYNHYLAKIDLKHNHLLGRLEEKLENYEIVALHSVLDDKHFQKLQIEKFKPTQIKKSDFLGIITEINRENKAVFEHLTFAEYFASKFLVKNVDKTRIFKEEIFTEKYQNLLLIFNIMLAEDSPLHLAIIYKDFTRIQEMEEASLVDKGGRNFLQVAACVATRHPPVKSYKKNRSPECWLKNLSVEHYFKGEDSNIKEIVNRVLSSEPFKNDKIFEWNSLDYALVNGALYIVEVILEKSGKSPNFYKMLEKYYSDEVVAYYSIRFRYHCLLSEILAKKSCCVTKIYCDYVPLDLNIRRRNINSVLNYIFHMSYGKTHRTRIVELLTDDNINEIIDEEDGYTFLHFAVFHKDINVIKILMQKGADVNVKDKNGYPSLLWALKKNNFEISKLLVENGADVNIKIYSSFEMNWTYDGNYSEISRWLGKECKWSPLFFAIENNNLEISKLLVENGADVNIKDRDQRSPLLYAVKNNNLEISKLLVENGADVNIKDRDQWSSLLYAVKNNNLEISKLLVENGADVNIKNEYSSFEMNWTYDRNNHEILRWLDKEDKWSPLFFAIENNNLEISKLLVENGADVNIKDHDQWSSLLYAVKNNNLEISKLLVENGADVNSKDENGLSPLHWAVEQDNLDISKLLLERGAEVNCETKRRKTNLASVIKSIKLLFSKEANVNENSKISQVLRLAAKNGNFNLVQILIEKGAIWDEQIIIDAIEGGNIQILKLFLEQGLDLSKVNDALHIAVLYNSTDVVNYLIDNGADVNLLNNNGFTILHEASSRGHLKTVEFLLNNPKTAHLLLESDKEESSTCLHLAVYFGHVEVVELLLKKIDLNKINIHIDKYPLHFAAKNGRLQEDLLIKMTRVVNELYSYSTEEMVNYFKNHPVISN